MTDTYIINGLYCKDHYFEVPLDHACSEGQQLTVYVREIASKQAQQQQLPYLVYFQGGPGFGAGRPMGLDGWIKAASAHYRVLLLDQRGTANSSPVTAQTLAHLTSEAQAAYLSHFRADNIVRDAELIRRQLIGDEKWSIIGQSFGGFCVLRYLSSAPEGLAQAFITGGIPSLARCADDVYQATFARVEEKNNQFFSRFPKAQSMAKAVADHLFVHDELLPDGSSLTVEKFQLLGIHLGMTGGHEGLYYLLEQAFADVNGKRELSYIFKHQFMSLLDYDTNPIFAFLHESIYCQQFASNWSAHRVRKQAYPQFDYLNPEQRFLFTGEMIFPWMFEQFANLKPLQQAAQYLAEKDDWPMLYDLDVLKTNQVPVAAAIYFNDMYVDINYSLETVAQVQGLETWVSSDYEHNGIRVDGELIFNKLHGLLNP
ncbi:alpha/beta fold hydrolase [Psychrobium sp. 1_MG-2023]|uniref:alpha/beta fold hydrolase n=1 Tax=Psychrobium sp. 1_MG-2023 TaxID=3062624 RepID=UPI000C34AD6B|nr:alpha/beta fold hydrolase [Psychrobium sp. 1_MG-2023]MDP2560405.1 alpha/beta fold hydrolase [Psychrobium sp. 1_MG-2023]PKF57926.1 alpha/beta hydrolase [Alteromonadales bacterium alter-6D02]